MRLILDIRDRRAKMYGLDAPARQEFSGPAGGPIITQTVTMSDEELDALIAEQRRSEALRQGDINTPTITETLAVANHGDPTVANNDAEGK
jgi:hypothetical protein